MEINKLVDVVSEINRANGWRDDTGAVLTEETPEAQVAGLSWVTGSVARVVEAIRKPAADGSVGTTLDHMLKSADYVHHMGEEDHAQYYVKYITNEEGQPVRGSKTQAICRLRLIDTETEEATQAVLAGDVEHLAEEVADGVIRYVDFVGDWNDTHPDQQIDLQAAIMEKLEVNRRRGYKHGGKKV